MLKEEKLRYSFERENEELSSMHYWNGDEWRDLRGNENELAPDHLLRSRFTTANAIGNSGASVRIAGDR